MHESCHICMSQVAYEQVMSPTVTYEWAASRSLAHSSRSVMRGRGGGERACNSKRVTQEADLRARLTHTFFSHEKWVRLACAREIACETHSCISRTRNCVRESCWWLIHMWCDLFIRDIAHPYVTGLFRMWHDSFIGEMCVRERRWCIQESFHLWMIHFRHVNEYAWVISHTWHD